MTFRPLTFALALCAALILGAFVNLQGQNAAAVKPVRIAVIDVQKVFSSLEERTSVEAEINQTTEKAQKDGQQKQTELQGIQADLKLLNENSAEYKRKRELFDQKVIELNVWKQYSERKIESDKAIKIEGLYIKIIDAVAAEAEKSGYDLVLYKEDPTSLRAQNTQQLTAMISLKKVLYAAKSLDITDMVAQKMNNNWNNRKPAGAGPATPPPAK